MLAITCCGNRAKDGKLVMFELSARGRFSAAHQLKGYPGACAEFHGHNWEVEVFVRGTVLDDTGILLDFRDLKSALNEVLEELDHVDLNSVAEFKRVNPTSEHLSRYIFRELGVKLAAVGGKLDRVSVYETPETRSTYWEE